MYQNQVNFCFCTLALGENYRNLALSLAKDLEIYSPTTPFVILTDKPQHFYSHANILAFKHRQQSIGCYHDKRFVIAKALSIVNSCIFIDADMRILAPVPQDIKWQPGITAKTVWTNIIEHNKNEFELNLLNKMAQKLNLNLENISFVHECLFVVTKQNGNEIEFLKQWEKIAPYFELNGFYKGEGHTIGLAATKVGFPIINDPMEYISFFKDKLELQKIRRGEVEKDEKLVYFQTQKTLEYPKQSFTKKLLNKLNKTIKYFYCWLELRIIVLKDIEFYYK